MFAFLFKYIYQPTDTEGKKDEEREESKGKGERGRETERDRETGRGEMNPLLRRKEKDTNPEFYENVRVAAEEYGNSWRLRYSLGYRLYYVNQSRKVPRRSFLVSRN